MKYCFNYMRRSKVLAKLDEVNIRFDKDDLSTLFNYIIEHKHQHINIRITEQDEIFKYNLLEKFENFKSEHKDLDFSIILPKYDLNLAQLCKQKELKFFFDIVVREWETFHAFIEAGVSDIYLVEQMMFEIKDAAAAAHSAGVKIRTFPNIAQKRYDETVSLKSFFIRPEDINLYEGLVDVMEIYVVDEINQDIVYEIYAEDKIWWGPIKEIIVGLDNDIDGKYIIPRFGERRLNCNRKCFKGQHCEVCNTIEQLSINLQKAGMLIQYEKERKKKEKEDTNNG